MKQKFSIECLFVIFCAAVLPLGFTAAADPQNLPPLVQVSRVSAAPIIDGKDNDPCWANTIAIQDFLTPASHRPAAEQSKVRFCWDDKNLYILARMDESILSDAAQRRHEIKASANRDGDLLKDDVFLVILRPENSETAFEFVINTKGVIADLKSRADDIWNTRDASWNAKIQAAASTGDGYWVAEMAIPWIELGVKAPVLNAQWKAIVARIAAARAETSSWNPSATGVHAPEQWGLLVFGDSKIGLDLASPIKNLEFGTNQLQLLFTPDAQNPANLSIDTEIDVESNGSRPQRERKLVEVSGKSPIKSAQNFESKTKSGKAAFTWSITDAATLQPLYRSPAITTEIQSAPMTVGIETSGAYRLFVNGVVSAIGNTAQHVEVSIALHSGVNVIAVELQSGTANVQLKSPDLGDAPIRWKMRDASDPQALKVDIDDVSWETAPEGKGHSQICTLGKPVVLRHTVVVRETRIFPDPTPALFVAEGGVQPVNFIFQGLPGRTLHHWQMYLDIPDTLTAVGSTGFYGGLKENKPLFLLSAEGEAGATRHFTVAADKPVEFTKGNPILSVIQVILSASEKANREKGYTLRYYASANEGTVSELSQEVGVHLLPPLNGSQPKTLTWQLWAPFLTKMDSSELRSAMLRTAQAAGFTDIVGAELEKTASYGLKKTGLISFAPGSIDLGPWLKAHPEDRLKNSLGEFRDDVMCTTLLLNQGWKETCEPILRKIMGQIDADTIEYDYEYAPFQARAPQACFCDRCLAEFRKAAGIADGTLLTEAIIEKKYNQQWVDFMARRSAKLFSLMKHSVHEISKKTDFTVYSDYQQQDTPARYGINWKYVGDLQAIDRAGVGYGRPVPAIYDTKAALPGIPVIFGELVTPYMANFPLDFDKPSAQTTKASLLRRSLDSSGGVLVYSSLSMDGRSWQAIADTTRLVSDYEQLFTNKRLESVAGQPDSSVQILKGDGVSLLCVMNLTNTQQDYRFNVPAALGAGREFYTQTEVKTGARLEINLQAGEAAVYIFNDKS